MTTTAAQQVALDNALTFQRYICIPSTSMIHLTGSRLARKRFTLNMEVFREIFLICPKLPNQEFDALTSDEEIISFIKELGHKGDIKFVSDAGMYYKKNVDFVELLWEDFIFQIDNRDTKKQEKMYYPRFTKVVIHHFITKDKTISMRNRLFMHTSQDDCVLSTMRFVSKSKDCQVYGALLPEVMTNQKMQNSSAYKNYLSYATAAATPKKARKFKKPASPSKKRTLVTVEEEEPEPAKKVGAGFELEVPDDPKGKSIDTSEGTSLKPGVPDVSKADSSESKYESWGDSGDEANVKGDDEDVQNSDDEPQYADDERTNYENQETNDDEEETDDEFVHTPLNYVPTDDETNDESNDVDKEEYDRIDKELYGDINVRLTDAKQDDEGEEDADMTGVAYVQVE
ncbi:hypothetical protein Tco_0114938 [Tanacetum coccineum]